MFRRRALGFHIHPPFHAQMKYDICEEQTIVYVVESLVPPWQKFYLSQPLQPMTKVPSLPKQAFALEMYLIITRLKKNPILLSDCVLPLQSFANVLCKHQFTKYKRLVFAYGSKIFWDQDWQSGAWKFINTIQVLHDRCTCFWVKRFSLAISQYLCFEHFKVRFVPYLHGLQHSILKFFLKLCGTDPEQPTRNWH